MTVVTNPACASPDDDIESGRESAFAEYDSPDLDENARLYESARLYENERFNQHENGKDVVFVAGMNGDTWRYPGHRRVLASTGPVFAALLSTKTDVIIVDHVDRRGFEQLLRYHYCEPTQLNSVDIARHTLDAAYKFLCPHLVERCAKRLDEFLDASIALDLLPDLRFMCARLPGVASAPPLPAFSNDLAAKFLAQSSRWCDSLAHNALLVIDDNADVVLTDERIEELCYEDLSLIVKRDTLRVSNELILIEALFRWATVACKRNKREITPANRRAALGGLSYCPRYLLLSGEELDRALGMELLEPIERTLVLAQARKLSAPVPVGVEQERLIRRWGRPRPSEPAALPVHLSARSLPPIEEPQPSKLCARRPKRLKEPCFGPEERPKPGCCASFGEGLLRAFICLFD